MLHYILTYTIGILPSTTSNISYDPGYIRNSMQGGKSFKGKCGEVTYVTHS